MALRDKTPPPGGGDGASGKGPGLHARPPEDNPLPVNSQVRWSSNQASRSAAGDHAESTKGRVQ